MSLSSKAQDAKVPEPKKSYFKLSASYLSNAVYYGRKDSFAVPYITPTISYYDKSGFYIEGSLSYLSTAGASGFDAGAISAGYEFNSSNEKLSGAVYASKYFTSTSSFSVHGEVNSELAASLDYNTGPVTINSGADISFASKTDFGVNLGLSHNFGFDDDHLGITPTFLFNAGTQKFYEDYYTKRKFSAKRKRRQTTNSNAIQVIVVAKKFAILDYELSLPINYDKAKWGLFFTPTYSLPVNGFQYSINNGLTNRTEVLSNTFYAEVGGYIKF